MQSYMKAIVAGLVAAITAAIPLVDDGVTVKDVLLIVLAGLVGSGITYVVPNKDPRGVKQDESVMPPERGATDVVVVLVVVVVVLLLLALFTRVL